MRIGELAARTGVSVRSLRYYEEQGLVASARSASGQRHYTESAVERVALIQQLYTAGLSSRTVAELLPCVDAPSHRATDVALEKMARERDRISAHLEQLAATRDALDAVMESARASRAGRRPAECAGDRPAERRAG